MGKGRSEKKTASTTKKKLLNTVQLMMKNAKKQNPFVNDRFGRKWFEVLNIVVSILNSVNHFTFLFIVSICCVFIVEYLYSRRSLEDNDLSIRTPERVFKARARVTETSIRQWFLNLQYNIREMGAEDIFNDPSRISNSDETCVQLGPTSAKVISLKGWKDIYTVAPGTEKSTLIFLGTVSANGRFVTPLVIYTYQRVPKYIANSVSDDFYMATSESG